MVEKNLSTLKRKIQAWRLLDNKEIKLSPLSIELIHIMLFRDWECGYKTNIQRDRIVNSVQSWISRLFDKDHLLPSPILYNMFINIEPFYFGNEETARIILRWRDNQIKKGKVNV